MKFQRTWLSTQATFSLLLSLLAKGSFAADTSGTDAVSPTTEEQKVHIDPSVFETTSGTKSHQFGAEVSRLLKILANSVYTDKKAVVRELLSNAIDAIKKQHEKQLSKAASEGYDDISQYRVVVELDKDNGILSFTDNGVGMTQEELKTFLGTIAKSGTAEFASSAAAKSNGDVVNLIGQFGVGFYSVLLVADKVAVVSKSDDDPKQWIWETDTSASFRITEDPNGVTLGRGTRVLLKIKPDSLDFLDHDKLENTMKEYFGYDRHQIYIVKPKTIEVDAPTEETDEENKKTEEEEKAATEEKKESDVEVEEEEDTKKPAKEEKKKISKTILEEVLISQNVKPVWQRSPSDVTKEEYETLYQSLSGDKYGKPIAYTHFSGETAKSESFRAVLFIPERPPFSPFSSAEHHVDLKLHVRGVFVTAKFSDDFIPKHLSFVRGIIDSDDISLNISREILQNTSELRGIRKKIIKKIIEMMNDLASDEAKYAKFYDAYHSFIKLEIAEHEEYRSLLSKLLRYQSTKTIGTKTTRSLEQYVEEMPEKQKEKKVIYFLAGKAGEIEKSPYLGRFQQKGYEVLLMVDPVDEHAIQKMNKYEEFRFENIAKDGIKLDDDEEKEAKEFEEKYKPAKEWMEKTLKDSFEKVVFSIAPENIPGSIKSSAFGWTGNMERIITSQTSVKDDPMMSFFANQKRILELNPKNAVVSTLLDRANNESPDRELRVTLKTLVDAMMIWSGYSIKDPARFASGIDRLTRKALNLPVDELPEVEEAPATSEADDPFGGLDMKFAPMDDEPAAATASDASKEDL